MKIYTVGIKFILEEVMKAQRVGVGGKGRALLFL